jgi:hypothetical protein
MSTEYLYDLRLIFSNSDALAKLEEVNRMLDKLGITWFKNLEKVGKVVSTLLLLSKHGTAQAATQDSKKPQEEKTNQKSNYDELSSSKLFWKNYVAGGTKINEYITQNIAAAISGGALLSTILAVVEGELGLAAGSVSIPGAGIPALMTLGSGISYFQDSVGITKDPTGAERDTIALKALAYFKEKGDQEAKHIFDVLNELKNQISVSDQNPALVGKFGIIEEIYKNLPGALEEIRNSDLGPALDRIIWEFLQTDKASELAAKGIDIYSERLRLSQKGYSLIADEADISTSSMKNLGKEVEGLGQECDSSAKSLSSFSKFLAEGKLGDLSHLDTSKQNRVFEAPSAELEDYEIDYPEKAPEPVKKGNYGIDEKVPFFSGRSNALPDEYNKQDTSKQNEEFPPPSAELDKYEIDYPEKAPGSGFFGGLKESFQSEWKAMKDSFGIGGGKGLLGNLFGGKDTGGGLFGLLGSFAGPQEGILGTMQQFASMIPGIGGMISNIIGGIGTAFNALKSLFGGLRRDIKGLIKYVCYRNYTNFLYKQNVVFFLDAVKQSLTLFCRCQAGVSILFVEKFKKAAKLTTQNAYI